ncbi:MAG: hypothetical protein P1V35_08510 [Planctomycetota bacterium]|nr:hypothetical protein [Planctomycetota bacterium]
MQPLAALLLCLLPIPQAPQETRAWQSESPYEAPDFLGYFPDDAQAGLQLDKLYDSNLRNLEDDEYLTAIRQGLRNTTQHRTLIISGVGQRFIWGKDPQNPDAVELMYHAADFRPEAQVFGTRHYAVYFGLSVVEDKPPAVLRTLAELCVAIDDNNDIGRVVWGAEKQLEQLLPYLDPFLESKDAWVRRKAENMGKVFRGELSTHDWATQRAKLPQKPVPLVELPELRRVLRTGSSELRLQVLQAMSRAPAMQPLHQSYLPDFALAAKDPDPRVRTAVAQVVSRRWIWRHGIYKLNPGGIALLMQLSHDPHADVRYNAVYYGLSSYLGEDERVVERMLEMCLDPNQERSHSRLIWGLGKYKESAAEWLLNELAGPTRLRARAAHRTWWALFESEPPVPATGVAQASDLVGHWKATLHNPQGDLPSSLDFEVTMDEQGTLHALGPGGAECIEAMVTTADNNVLHFSFETTRSQQRMYSSGQLDKGEISASTRMQGSFHLVVWTARRKN